MDSKRFQRLLARTFAAPIIVIGVLAGALLWLNSRQEASISALDTYDRVILESGRVLRLMIDQETGMRGYLLTGDARFLEPYDKAAPTLEDALRTLTRLVADNPAQIGRIQRLHSAYANWQRYSQEMISARQQGGDYQSSERNIAGKALMDDIREQRESFVNEEQRLRDQRVQAVRRDGQIVWAGSVGLAMLLAALLAFITRRQVLKITGSYREALDDAQRRAAELSGTREQLAAVLASMAEGLYQLDTEGRLVYLNPAAERLLGYRLEEIRGQNMHDVVHSRTPDGHGRSWEDCPLVAVVKKGVEYHAPEDYLVRKDGSFLPVETTSSPIVINGKIFGAVLTFRDLTDRKRSERALRSSDKLAATGRIAATLAHEINNPLDAVGNLLYLLKDKPQDRESRELVDTARQELQRVLQITRNMLSMHREAQEPVAVKMTEMLDGVLSLYERKLKLSRIQVERRYDDPGEVLVFPGEVRQVVSNLLGNAVEAMGTRGGKVITHVYLDHERHNSDRPGVRVVIADDGPGIPEEHRKKIFEPFYTTKAEKGTGLGLWISQDIVQKHEGKMSMRSSTNPGRSGTVFSIFLPRKQRLVAALERTFPASA
ncbi:MAG: CHASE3 domain-containing protein [Acidobacteria bacterium]|nr:CHASE3 domain-containing protein [Acidobacteriota bacterium]